METKISFTSDLDNPKVINCFIEQLNEHIKNGDKEIVIEFSDTKKAFPNTCVPIAGIIEYLKMNHVFDIRFMNTNQYLKDVAIEQPLRVIENKLLAQKDCLNKIWRFDSIEDAYILVNSFVQELSQVIVCEKGVLDGFAWAINEVLDNVIQHSGKNYGYVMGQVHKRRRNFVFCIYDTGMGIFKSLEHSIHKPKNPAEALKLAVKERVTRDKKVGQGNGLWGLSQIIKENTGILNIISDRASYKQTNLSVKTTSKNIQELIGMMGCSVDFQLNYKKEISISKALGGYEYVNVQLEEMEDETGNIQIKLQERNTGVGTRKSGEKIRNELINIYHQTGKKIILDFSNINVISSSFADELIGKLAVKYGFVGFNNLFALKNMSPTVQTIVQRSVAQRMMESFE